MFACLYRPPALDAARVPLVPIAEEFSPRYQQHSDHLIVIDISGLERLLGTPREVGEQMRREAMDRGVRAHVAVARTRVTALLLACARPGLTVVEAGSEATALAPLSVRALQHVALQGYLTSRRDVRSVRLQPDREIETWKTALTAIEHWGVQTLGALVALPSQELSARLGVKALAWQRMARGIDLGPLVPSRAEERFEASLELEWPIEGLEPLSFVLTRLLEPLSTRLEQRDRGVAVLHVALRLVTPLAKDLGPDMHVSRLELPSPMRDVRSLRTLALLDLEARPPSAAIEEVTITIEPTPGRILQHTLFTRPHPTPEQLSTLLARLGALMGTDRVGAAATVDSYRPGAFALKPFPIEHQPHGTTRAESRRPREDRQAHPSAAGERAIAAQAQTAQAQSMGTISGALRRWRPSVPARVAVLGVGSDQRPVRVTTDRPGIAGGAVVSCAGPWRTSGAWWEEKAGDAGQAGRSRGGSGSWNRDEWDVALNDGTVYRIFQDRSTHAWFIDAIVD